MCSGTSHGEALSPLFPEVLVLMEGGKPGQEPKKLTPLMTPGPGFKRRPHCLENCECFLYCAIPAQLTLENGNNICIPAKWPIRPAFISSFFHEVIKSISTIPWT